MARYIVAVSGGVDSVVLLHKLICEKKHQIVVAHFDHGIRSSSADDTRFVEGLALQYDVVFETRRTELGSNASEAIARQYRYEFLRDVARKHEATIATAHHADDVIESIAINLTRGTGWRGLAVMSSLDIERPLLHESKAVLYDYALEQNLEWVEDETNQSEVYLRNRLRKRAAKLDQSLRAEVLMARKSQLALRREIDVEEQKLKLISPYSRYFFTHIDLHVATELIRHIADFQLTRPQALRLLHAIKVAQPGTMHHAGQGRQVRFTQTDFIVETP